MNLKYYLLNEPYEINSGEIMSLIIENLDEYRKLVESLYANNYLFKLYDNEEVMDKNIFFISDIYFLDFNDRKIKNLILNKVEDIMDDEYNITNTLKIKNDLFLYFDNIFFECNIPVNIDQLITNKNILKSITWNVIKDEINPIENLMNYLDILIELLNIKVVVTKNADLNFNEKEYECLIDYLKIKELSFITIERQYIKTRDLKNRKILLFDEDLCRVI